MKRSCLRSNSESNGSNAAVGEVLRRHQFSGEKNQRGMENLLEGSRKPRSFAEAYIVLPNKQDRGERTDCEEGHFWAETNQPRQICYAGFREPKSPTLPSPSGPAVTLKPLEMSNRFCSGTSPNDEITCLPGRKNLEMINSREPRNIGSVAHGLRFSENLSPS